MNFEEFLNTLRSSPVYRNQILHSHVVEEREASCRDTLRGLSDGCRAFLLGSGIVKLYTHQAAAVDAVREGRDVLVATGTASGKSLAYQLPLIEMLESEPNARALLLHPTKALSQDQHASMRRALAAAKLADVVTGVYDGDTPASARRVLRDNASMLFTNPDMLHASLMPQHPRWAEFLQRLRFVIVDELHTYSGLFGSNAANMFRRFHRLCAFYGCSPQFVLCSATIGNPAQVAHKLTGREPVVIDEDGSPRGKRTYVFWNPPRIRKRRFKSRRSANVEAHELMAELVKAGVPTITFSKAKITAELIYRYLCESLRRSSPHLADKVTSYRGGYLPEERREIERRLFSGELIGVSTTPALELGIDVGGLDASLIVGYPGTVAGFLQQAGRAGRRDREALSVLVAVDTSINQYIMKHPEYVFGRPVERVVLEPDNPYVLSGHMRCAAFELPLAEEEVDIFGPHARVVLDVLTEQGKLSKVRGSWYSVSEDVPQHEVSLRDICDRNVAITDVDTGRVIGELNKFDAQPIIHPDAIYIHQGETYLVLELDLDRMLCLVKKVETPYYTQPLGGTDVHHIDQPLRQRPFGTATACFGEVTAYFRNDAYERISFYDIDAVSVHPLNMPTWQLQTMAMWITPPEELVREMIAKGLDVHKALMGIGYATRMILPLFIQCETLDFSHSSCTAVNAPWHTVFIYERYPHGLGFTEQAFELLADVMPAVYEHIRSCECANGCPCCVGKPLREFATWNIERGEASIPSKRATLRLLEGILGDRSNLREPDSEQAQDEDARRLLLERGIRRRLEKLGDPDVFHPIDPKPQVGFPDVEQPAIGPGSDVARRAFKRLHLEKRIRGGDNPSDDDRKMHPLHEWGPPWEPPAHLRRNLDGEVEPPGGWQNVGSRESAGPVDDSSRITKETPGEVNEDTAHERVGRDVRSQSKALRNLTRRPRAASPGQAPADGPPPEPQAPAEQPAVPLGDSLASRARKLRKRKKDDA